MCDGSEVIPCESESLEIYEEAARTSAPANGAPMAGNFPTSPSSALSSSRLQSSDQHVRLATTHGPTGGHEMFEVARWWKHSGFDVIPLNHLFTLLPPFLQDFCANKPASYGPHILSLVARVSLVMKRLLASSAVC